jgi:hypothetical protein
MRVKVNVVLLRDPCSACFIIGGLIKEMMDKLQKEMDCIDLEFTELEDLKNLHNIEGLEVESFPAVIINGEQITAGTIPDKMEIIKRLEFESKNNI